MAKNSKNILQVIASKEVQKVLVALLFITMGIVGFSSGNGIGSEISQEISNMFGGDSELLLYIVSALELICGVFLVVQLLIKGVPVKFTKLTLTIILIFWIILIIVLDILAIDFGRFDGSDWISWIELVVLHLIVLTSIIRVQE